MTITSTVTTFETTGNGVNTSFIFNYPIHKARDLQVYVGGALKITSDTTYPHTITVASNKQSATVVFTHATPPANLIALKFVREVEYVQETDLANNSLFDAESLETTLDNIVMQLQQVGAVVTSTADSRTFSFHGGIATSDYLPSTPSDASTLNSTKAARLGKALMFDATSGNLTISGDNLDTTIDYQKEAKDWASKASGNVNTYTGGIENSDGSLISAKANAALTAADVVTTTALYDNFDDRYLGVHTTAQRESGVGNIGKDHDGVALVTGALYYDSDKAAMMAWSGSAWVQLAPSSSNQTAINTVIANPLAANIALVAAIDDDVTKVADIDGDVSLVADIDGYVTTVAVANTNVTKVAAVDSEITLLGTSAMATASSGHLALLGTSAMAHAATGHIKSVADLDTEVGLLGALNTEIGLIGTSAMAHPSTGDIKVVADIQANVTKVADLDTEVGLLGNLDTEIGLIGTSAYAHASTGFIKLVADDATDIGTVAGKANEIGLLGTTAMAHASTGNLTLLGVSAMAHATTGYLKLVGDIDGEITLLGTVAMAHATTGHIALLGTSAIANTTNGYLKVLGNTTVTDDMAILGSTTVTDDMALLADNAVIADMALLATTAIADPSTGDLKIVADSIADVNRYANEYKIQTTEPGSPSEGDIWMDTSSNHVFKVHNGTSFVTVTEGQTAAEVTAEATAQAISMSIALG